MIGRRLSDAGECCDSGPLFTAAERKHIEGFRPEGANDGVHPWAKLRYRRRPGQSAADARLERQRWYWDWIENLRWAERAR